MNVGLINLQFGNNHGAVLQCLALQQAISRMGHEVEVIDFRPQGMRGAPFWRGWGIKSSQTWRQSLESSARKWRSMRRDANVGPSFEDFRQQHLNRSAPVESVSLTTEFLQQYDAIVTGSDQVWNFNQYSEFFLHFRGTFGGCRVSYAACCSRPQQSDARREIVTPWLREIDCISVRNEFSRQLVAPLVERPVTVVSDPTLLECMEEAYKEIELPEKYILIYRLSPEIHGGFPKVIEAIRQRYGQLPVVAIEAGAYGPDSSGLVDLQLRRLNPGQWATAIAKCSFLLTDSFHGTLFALKHERTFLTYYAGAREGQMRVPRLSDACARYGCKERLIATADEAVETITSGVLDTPVALQPLQREVESSRLWLREALLPQADAASSV